MKKNLLLCAVFILLLSVASAQTEPPSSPPLADSLAIFWRGFLLQIGFEVSGMVVRLLRSLRASGSVDLGG